MIVAVFVILALLYLLYLGVMYKTQARMVFTGSFMGPRLLRKECCPEGQWLVLGEHQVDALYLGAKADAQKALIVAHGNAQTLEDWVMTARWISESYDLPVLIVEYPRFQESPQHPQPEPTQESVAAGFVAGYDWLLEQGIDSIHALGLSIGTGVICDLSRRRSLASLCLLAPFHSIDRLSLKYLVPAFVLKTHYRNTEALAAFSGKVLILQALHDQLFKTPHVQALLAAQPSAELIEVPCAHNAVPDHLPEYRSQLEQLWNA